METIFVSTNPAASLFPISKTLKPNSRTPSMAHLRFNQLGFPVSLTRGMGALDFHSRLPLSSSAGSSDSCADVSALSSDVIILQVGGMTCGGCSASVKRILESQPHVSSANVDLTTELATVWPACDANYGPNWQVQLGEALANHLTNCGFKSKLKGQGSDEGGTSS